MPVQHGHTLPDLGEQPERLVERQGTLGDPVGDTAPVGVGHHKVGAVVGQGPDVVDTHQPLGVGLAQDARLFDETLVNGEVVCPVLSEHFDSDRGVEQIVVSQPDGGERARTQPPQDAITPETFRLCHRYCLPRLGDLDTVILPWGGGRRAPSVHAHEHAAGLRALCWRVFPPARAGLLSESRSKRGECPAVAMPPTYPGFVFRSSQLVHPSSGCENVGWAR